MRRAKIDQNQPAIVDVLERGGCLVQSLARMGDGVPDLLVAGPPSFGRGQRLALVEVKQPKGKLRPEQERFMARGWPVFVLRDVEAAAALVRWLREEG